MVEDSSSDQPKRPRVAVVIDRFSRRVCRVAVYESSPPALENRDSEEVEDAGLAPVN